MNIVEADVCVLLVDVSGSTALYDKVGDVAALAQISEYIDRIKQIIAAHGGEFIHSKGDDILCTFQDPHSALAAIRGTLRLENRHGLSIHAGLHFGPIVRTKDDIYGDTVNLAARLASTANNGEVLISDSFAEHPGLKMKTQLRYINSVTFKGKPEPVGVYTLRPQNNLDNQTQIGGLMQKPKKDNVAPAPRMIVQLDYEGQILDCSEGNSITVGRSEENDLIISQPWVSRRHAAIELRNGKTTLTDRSSGGTIVTLSDGTEISVVRETVLLTGSGQISLTVTQQTEGAMPINFKVLRVT